MCSFNHDSIIQNGIVPASIEGYGDTDLNHLKFAPEIINSTQLGMFRKIAQAAAKRHILVMLVAIKCYANSTRSKKPGGLW